MDDPRIQSWLSPLDEDTTGPDLEYDPTYLELEQAANGRPETQFGPAEPPSWLQARELSESLLERTRDLRVAMLWTRAAVNLEGLEGLAPGLALLHGLMDNFWETVHPRPDPDDGDTFARISTLGNLDSMEGLLGDVRQSQLIVDRRMGGLRVRDAEIALERLAPREDESSFSPAQITGQIGDLPDVAVRLGSALAGSSDALKALQSLMNDRFGTDAAVDLKALRGMVSAVQSLLPDAGAATPADGGDENSSDDDSGASGASGMPAAPSAGGRRGGVQSIESRQDAVRAINLICAYLERHEPTNPAQLLLRRAERLIEKNFLQLVRDLAPDALNEVARILGVDPDTVRGDSDSY